MRPDFRVSVQFQANSNLLYFASHGEGLSLHHIALLFHPDDMVLFSTNPENLVLMLQCMDTVIERFAMKINARKTKVMLVGKGDSRLPTTVTITGGHVEQVGSFKYLGGILTSIANLEAEVNIRRGRGLGAFAQFSHLWGNRHLGVSAKVHVFNTFVLPHFVYGSETWNVTQSQQYRLEAVYNNCLRGIMGVRASDRHNL
jgi:hypothetical protein